MKVEVRHATVAFVDIEGFTALSESLGPEQSYLIVTRLIKLLDSVARKHGGSVDKYLGDSIMAVFGYPVPLDEAEVAAAQACVEMRQCVHDYNRELGLSIPLDVRIGINTGSMVAGDIRGAVVREFHVLGDAVNVAARLKAKAPRGGIYVGPETYTAAREKFEYRPLQPLKLKGKTVPVETWELVSERAGAEPASAGLGGASFTELLGREMELEQLREAARRAEAGTGAAVFLVGEEGIGKSRLIAELERSGGLESYLVLRCPGALARGQESLHPFRSMLRSWAGAGEVVDGPRLHAALRAALDAAIPERGSDLLGGLSAIGSGDASVDSARPALEGLLEGLCGRQPVCILLEDWHRADAESAGLLERLLGLLEKLPLLLLVSLRPGVSKPADQLRDRARKHAGERCQEIELGPLDPGTSRSLVDRLLEDGLVQEQTRALVATRAAGNPARLILGAFAAPAIERDQAEAGPERGSDAERRRATILFADITGFTAMTENLGAERAYPVVARCLRILDEVARKHRGTVDKYLGDCVMALFGVPEAIEDAPRAAINAAIEMRQRVRDYGRELDVGVELDVHTGIHTGLGIAGDISGPLIREFTVMGDPVSVADSLKDLAPSGHVYVGPEVHRFTRDVFEFEALEPAEIPGQQRRLPIFDMLSRQEQVFRARVGAGRQVFSALVGRDEEIEALREQLRGVRDGRGGIVSLIADAGVGKSRLVAELAASEEAQQVAWREGRSISSGAQLSFGAFADLCRAWAQIGDKDDEDRAREKMAAMIAEVLPESAEEVFPLIARVLGMRLDPDQQEWLDRIQGDSLEKLVRHNMTELLRRASEQAPVVVVMDDLHWADLSSIELLESLLRLSVDHSILFLHVFRPGFAATSQRTLDLVRADYGERHLEIELQPLDGRAARQLLGNIFPHGDLPHATRTLIEEKARGNPFFIEEVVRSLVDEGAVENRDGTLRVTERIHSVEIPGTVQEVVMGRVDRLPLEKRQLLQVASVIGGTFHEAVLANLVGDAVEGQIAELLAAEFLVPSDRSPGIEFAFKHPLIQEVTYDSLLEARRKDLHVRVGESIEGCLSEDVPGYLAMLAYHFSLGGDAERSEVYLFRAGDEAARSAASSEALQFFTQASKLYLEIHGEGGDPRKKAQLERNVGLALFNRGQLIESVDHFDHALEHLGRWVPRHGPLLQARFAVDMVALLAGLYLPGRRRRRPASTESEREVIDVMFKRGLAETTTAPTRLVFDTMSLLRALARVDPTTVPEAGGMYGGAVAIFSYGGVSFALGLRFLELARQVIEASDDRDLYLYYRVVNFVHHFLSGDWSAEHEIDDALLDENLRAGRLWEVTTYLGLYAEKCIRRGRFAEALERMGRIDRIWENYEYDLAKTNHYWLPTCLLLEQRRLPEALRAADDYYDENPEDLLHLLALSSKAEVLLLMNSREDAEESLERASKIVARSGPAIPFHLASYLNSQLLRDVSGLDETVGDGRSLRAAWKRAKRSRRRAVGIVSKVAYRGPEVFRNAGRAAWLAGRPSEAQRLWSRSIQSARELEMLPDLARTYSEVGRHLARDGRGPRRLADRDADSYLEEARGIFTQLDLRWDLERLETAASP